MKTLIVRTLARLAFVLFLLAAEEQAGAQTWTTVNSNPAINGMFMLNSSTGWTVGPFGAIRMTTDGTNWGLPTYPTTSSLISVWASDGSHLWAVGTAGAIVFWNGSSWSTQTSGTTQSLLGVWGTDANHVWAVGQSGAIVYWNGSTWTPQTSGTTQSLSAVWGVDATHVWAVGNGGTVLFWNGTAWSAQTSGTTQNLSSVWAADANNVWATANTVSGLVLYWNGSSWTSFAPVPSGTYSGAYYCVRGLNASNVWIGGAAGNLVFWNGSTWSLQNSGLTATATSGSAVSGSAVWLADGLGEMRRWNGTSWVSPLSSLNADLMAISGSAANNVMAPDFGTGLKKFNGTAWTSQSGLFPAPLGCFVLDSTHAWVSGSFGGINFWNGSFWGSQTSGTTNSLNGVWAANATNAWAVGNNGTILKWNGTSWSAQTSAFVGANIRAVWGTDANNVWAADATGGIQSWNGTSWVAQTSGTATQLNAVWGSDSTHIWAVGNSGTIRFWDGTSWAAQTSGTTNALNGMWGTSATDVYAVGASGTILHWNGTAWSAQTSGTSQRLNGIWGQAGGTVWAVGSGATILGTSLAATSPLAALQQPAGTTLTSGIGHVAFPSVNVGTAAGAKTFTIQNSGTAALTVTSASVSGGNAADYTVNTAGMAASVAAGGSTTFTVNCTPSAAGARSTTLSVVTGDIFHSPITVTLDGTGIATTPYVVSPIAWNAGPTTATLGGNVTGDGGATITERGVVYSATATNGSPVIGGTGVTKATTSGTTGAFTVNISSLTLGTQYSFAAYATNSLGTTYTGTGTFTTRALVSGTKTVGSTGNYASLGAAIADLSLSAFGGPVVLELQAGYVSTVETFPITFANLGTSVTNTVTLRPQSGATNLSITSADTTAATVDLNGAQFVTIDGRPGGTGTVSQLSIANTSTSGVAVRFINEASNNTLRNLMLQGVNASATSGTVVFSTTTGANGNDNNTIDHCDIRDGASTPANGIYSLGTPATAAQNNSGNTVSNCNIFNFYPVSATESAGVRLDDGSTDWTITGNSFYQTVARAGVTANLRAIHVNNTSGNNFIINGNFIGGTASGAGGPAWPNTTSTFPFLFQGIRLSVGTATPSSVQGNTIRNIVWSSTGGGTTPPGFWSGIYVQAGSANIGTVTGNTIGSGTGTGSVTTTSGGSATTFGIASSSSGTVAISNNIIGSITVNGTGTNVTGSLIGIQVTTGTNTISGNTVGSTTSANSLNAVTASTSTFNSQQVTGILTSSSTSASITNNTVANLNNNYAGTVAGSQVRGIVTTAGVNTITGNTVRNLSTTSPVSGLGSSSAVVGISQTSVSASQTVSRNVIHSMSNTAASAGVMVTGIYYSGAATGTNVIAGNFIHSLAVASISPVPGLRGLDFGGGAFTVRNNMVRLGLDATGASTGGSAGVYGIVDNNSVNGRNFFHNTILVSGVETSGSVTTIACWSFAVGNTRSFQNNIFANIRSNSGGNGFHYAVSYGGTAANPAGLTASNNLFFVNNGAALGSFNGVLQLNLAGWQGATGQDAASVAADPLFIAPGGTAATVDLHIASSSPANNAGLAGTGVTDDFDGQIRSTITPSIGADEITAPNIVVTQTAALTDGVSSVDFGTITLGSSSSAKTFTITNPGTADLTSLVVTKDGTNAADFTVSALSGTSVPVGSGSVTFTVSFTPGASGARSAAIHIASNVTGAKNPFDIALTGTGNAPPTLTLPASPVIAEATSASGAAVIFTVTANDAEDGALTPGVVPPSGSTFPIGDTTVNVSATDSGGATVGGSFIVRVRDTTAPVVAAHANVTAEATSATGAVVAYAAGSATDAVTASPAITYSQNSGTTFPIGVTTLTISAKDLANNTGMGTFTVTVRDTIAPVVTPPANVTVHATSPSGAVAAYSAASASDAVGVVSLTYSQASGSTFATGTTTVTVTARDAANNAGTATFTVTVTPLTTVESWRYANFGTVANTGNTADNGDFDSDGVVNLMEFAFGTDPTSTASGPAALQYAGTFAGGGAITATGQPITMLESIANGVDFRALFVRRSDYAAAGLTYTPQFSASMATWADSAAVPTVLADDGTNQIVSVPYPPFVGGKKARFFRISVSLAP